jgi:4-amino-4-deoxy-L-arabinose transferase-like glycosyltransferase
VQSPQQSDERHESRWGGPRTVLALVLLGAAVLRLVGIHYGLPHGNLLNPDEAEVVPRAWEIANGGGADPSPFFDQPSLLLYVLAPFQWWQPEPSYLTARLLAVVIGVAGVAAAWWLGERAYGLVGGGVAAVVTGVAGVHVAYSRAAVADVLLTTLVTVVLALLVSGRIEAAGAVAGLAVAARWPGVLLAAPLVVAAWGQWRRLAYAGGYALGAFVVASPFAVVHAGEAASDLWRGLSRARDGWLGFEDDSFAAIAFVASLWDSIGPVLLVAAAGLAVAIARREAADQVLLAFALVYYVALLPVDAHFDRYVLPLVPVFAVFAGRFAAFAPVTLLLLVVAFTWTVRDTEELTKRDTRAAALPRVNQVVGAQGVRVDPGLPEPRGVVARLALPGPWAEFDPQRSVDAPGYVWVNGDVVDRVRAAASEYPREVAFYAALEREARLVFRVEPDGELAGPWTALFQLPSRR